MTPSRITALVRKIVNAFVGALLSLAILAGCQVLTEAPVALPEPVIEHEVAIPAPKLPPRLETEVVILPPPDLWQVLRANMRLDHALENKRVQAEIAWLKRHPNYLLRLQPRMERHLAYITDQVLARDMPAELALLPIIESALDPYAFSPGGAAGLWQIIPATAGRFGLEQSWWQDQRRDPIAATEAALNYLEFLERRFDDWLLALAGYNAGEGNVSRAKRRGSPGDTFWELKLPRETRAYVPRLLAVSAVVADPGRFGLSLPDMPREQPFVTLDTRDQFDLMKAAEALGTEIEVLYEWNPALNQWATPPAGPHRLLVPEHLADTAQAQLDAVPEKERVQWRRVEVAQGDSLSGIALAHNTDVATLKRVNRLRGSMIRAGDALFVPGSTAALDRYPMASRTRTATYSVQPGDSLWSISREFDIALNKLMRLNHIGPKDVLRIGQQIKIPGTSRDVVRTVNYRVRRGDSLARIASKFDVTVKDIARWNGINPADYLQPGQRMKLHVNVIGNTGD